VRVRIAGGLLQQGRELGAEFMHCADPPLKQRTRQEENEEDHKHKPATKEMPPCKVVSTAIMHQYLSLTTTDFAVFRMCAPEPVRWCLVAGRGRCCFRGAAGDAQRRAEQKSRGPRKRRADVRTSGWIGERVSGSVDGARRVDGRGGQPRVGRREESRAARRVLRQPSRARDDEEQRELE
jgi:hypothetical protein